MKEMFLTHPIIFSVLMTILALMLYLIIIDTVSQVLNYKIIKAHRKEEIRYED